MLAVSNTFQFELSLSCLFCWWLDLFHGDLPIKHTYDVSDIFLTFQKLVKNLFYCRIKAFQSDGWKEFDNDHLKAHFLHHYIYFWKSCPRTLEQNGAVEQKHRYIIEMTRTILLDANLPSQLWVHATYTTIYIINRLPTPLLDNHSLFEKLLHKEYGYSFLSVLGCKCFPTLLTQPWKPALLLDSLYLWDRIK